LTLLAATETGWRNLKQLSTRAYQEGFHYRPRIDQAENRVHTQKALLVQLTR
jgi:DNA polymerase III alpha subunit